MSFIHDSPEFGDLLQVVAAKTNLSSGLVEKDYWVSHTLWGLHQQGLQVWFKGGTSLSKGFGLIQRFSEDLDLKLEPGELEGIPTVTSWKSEGKTATASRKAFFEALEAHLQIPGAQAVLDHEQADRSHRSAMIQIRYPGQFLGDLGGVLRPFVLLEIGSARVTPFLTRDMSSFVHDHLVELSLLDEFTDNRPIGVRCVHPLVTLLEKIDAIQRRFPRLTTNTNAATFVRHYEDAARIIDGLPSIPPLEVSTAVLVEEMQQGRQIRPLPDLDGAAFQVSDTPEWHRLQRAFEAIGPMFWGARIPLPKACTTIRDWVEGIR